MTAVLNKPADQIDIDDIHALILEKVPEGTQIEFKECLPSRDGKSDPWSRDGSEIGDRAKNEILEEVTAFANAYGGALVLGIAESRSKPPIAEKVTPVPRCADLAARFRQVLRDRVEPQLPILDVIPITTEGDEGVIVFRTGKSRQGPHRVNFTKHTWKCPIRRYDRCEAMSMRGIQDMTLNLARGLEGLEKRLRTRGAGFQKEFERLETPEDAFGFRMTAAPVGDDIRFSAVYSGGNLVEELRPPKISVKRTKDGVGLFLNSIEEFYLLSMQGWRPMLRAARSEANLGTSAGFQQRAYVEVHADGLLEFGFVAIRMYGDEIDRREDRLNVEIPVSTLAQLLSWVNLVRNQASVPGIEYCVEIELKITAEKIRLQSSRHLPFIFSDPIVCDNKIFPLYFQRSSAENNNLISVFEKDFWNYFGSDTGEYHGKLEIIHK